MDELHRRIVAEFDRRFPGEHYLYLLATNPAEAEDIVWLDHRAMSAPVQGRTLRLDPTGDGRVYVPPGVTIVVACLPLGAADHGGAAARGGRTSSR